LSTVWFRQQFDLKYVCILLGCWHIDVLVRSRGNRNNLQDQQVGGAVQRTIAVKSALASEATEDTDTWSYTGDPNARSAAAQSADRSHNTGKQ